MKKKLQLLSIFIILIATNLNIIACKNDQIISNFYVLGDSLSDIGAGTFAQNQYLMYDNHSHFKHFQLDEPYYNNCWSNGKVASQLIAEKFNINVKPGWLFKINGKTYQNFGNNYAYGGEVVDSSNNFNLIVKKFDLCHQSQMLLLQHHLHKKDVIWIEMAANDIASLMTKLDCNLIKEKIIKIINIEKKVLDLLIKNGAKKIIISDVPDLTLTPKIKKILHNNNQKLKIARETCFQYQKQWKVMIFEIKKRYNNIIIPYFLSKELSNDIIEFKDKISNGIVETSATYSKMISTKTSYSYKPIFNTGVNKFNLNKYFYFDEFHPGMWFHQQMTKNIINLIKKYL